VAMFMTAGPGNPLLVLEGCQNMQRDIWTKGKKVSNVAEWNEVHGSMLRDFFFF